MYVVIIGGGQIGSYMADLLKRNKLDFVVIDSMILLLLIQLEVILKNYLKNLVKNMSV